MRVTQLNLENFRNFTQAEIHPQARFNVISGLNGAGKTNLLEALFWLATLRPARTTRLRELVRWDARGNLVSAEIQSDGLTHLLSVGFKDGQRFAKRENKAVRSSDYFGPLSVVLFTPEDATLIREAPEGRRKFLDRAIFTGRTAHLSDCVRYRRALDARNKLLRDGGSDEILSAYEETLAQYAARVLTARLQYIEELAPVFESVFTDITSLSARLKYRTTTTTDRTNIHCHLVELWRNDRAKDRLRGFTQRGPHADDFQVFFKDRAARSFASQGQQRAMVLALKIAEIGLLEEKYGRRPILLLDDVSSELDAQRNQALFNFLNRFEGQVFITTTDPSFLDIRSEKCVWVVRSGEICEMQD